MATIEENLLELNQVKSNFKSVIESKGQDLTNVPFTQYPNKANLIIPKGTPDMLQAIVDQTQSLASMFANPKIVNLDLSNLDTSEVTTMQKAFNNNTGIRNIIGLNKLNTGKVTDMSYMFSGCYYVQPDVSNFDTSKVTNMSYMFNSCQYMTEVDVSNWNTTNVTNMSNLFDKCFALKKVDLSNWNTSNVTNMSNMFTRNNALVEIVGLSSFDTSNVTNFEAMFQECNKLTSLDVSSFNTGKATRMIGMFGSLEQLEELDLSNFNTKNVTNMNAIFSNCKKLKSITNIDMFSLTDTYNIFYNCNALENLNVKNIKRKLQIGSGVAGNYNSWGTLLTNESLINTFKELWDLTGQTSQILTLSTTSKNNIANIYVKLIDVTDEMLAQDQYAGNKKPCVVCEPTDEGAMTLTEYATSKNWAIA